MAQRSHLTKKSKLFYAYEDVLARLKERANNLQISESQIIEALVTFGVNCPDSHLKKIYSLYHFYLSELFDKTNNDEEIDFDALQEKILQLIGEDRMAAESKRSKRKK
jgi:hypothetical protein